MVIGLSEINKVSRKKKKIICKNESRVPRATRWTIFENRVLKSYRHDREFLYKYRKSEFFSLVLILGTVCFLFKVTLYTIFFLFNPMELAMAEMPVVKKKPTLKDIMRTPMRLNDKIEPKQYQHSGVYDGNTYYPTFDICNEDRTLVRGAASSLRRAIYNSHGVLNCMLVKSEYRKVSSEELLEAQALGEFTKPFLVQHITFGEVINKAIKVILGERIEMIAKKGKTYLVVHNGNIPTLAREIGKLFNEEVLIKVSSD